MIIPDDHNQIISMVKCARCNRLHATALGTANCCKEPRRITWPDMPSQQPFKPLPEPTKKNDMAKLYPAYYKDVSDIQVIDVYGVHDLFKINDPSGAIQHASKKLLLSGVRTGGKTMYQDIKEARDTLNRWLELNQPTIPRNDLSGNS